MDRLRNLTELFNNISQTCEQIIRKSVPVMKNILENKDNILESSMKKYPNLSEKEVKQKLQTAALNLVTDSKTIKREMTNFVNSIVERTSMDESNTPFLTEVWMGDAYDCQGTDALEVLLAELKEQLKNCTMEYIAQNI